MISWSNCVGCLGLVGSSLISCFGLIDEDGLVDLDEDGSLSAVDCNDFDAAVHPGATEVCDGLVDEDCDGLVDDADPGVTGTSAAWLDADGDGFGTAGDRVDLCVIPDDRVETADDCDDEDARINPDAMEVCGGIDEDCDGAADDADPDSYPGATELCADGVDQDCDGSAGPCALDGDIDSSDADAVIELGDDVMSAPCMGGDADDNGRNEVWFVTGDPESGVIPPTTSASGACPSRKPASLDCRSEISSLAAATSRATAWTT